MAQETTTPQNDKATGGLPNIVVIMVDDLGYGDLSSFNAGSKIRTKNLDQLAREGMRFTDAHAPGPLCHLSRYGLLTGRYPFRTKVGQWRKRAVIEPDQTTIASLLKSAGYSTAMVGKWHLGFNFTNYEEPMLGGPVDCGFDSFFGIRASTDIPPYFYIRDRNTVRAPTQSIAANSTAGWSPIQGKFWRAGKIAPDMSLDEVLPRFTDEAIQVIGKHAKSNTDEPLMLYLAYPAPHTPWLPADQYLGQSQAGLYGDFVVMVDDMIGKVLESLKSNGMKENTIVVFTSDNGPVWYDQDVERFGHDSSGGLRGMKADAWEAGHRMPFIVRWPGVVEPGAASDRTICFTDMMATFAELTGQNLNEMERRDSDSFLSELKNMPTARENPRRPLVMASGNGMMTIRSGDWKLIDGLGSGGFSKPGRIRPKADQPAGQLYNLKQDPAETKNLFSARPELVQRLQAEMQEIVGPLAQQQKTGNKSTSTSRKPNIVLVMADDQGWGQTGFNGHPLLKTPNLDAMAANGLQFNRFYASAPVCSPTRASVLTGRTNRRTGVELYGFSLRRQEKTIAQLLAENGYATGHFGKWHLNGLKGPGIPILADDTHHPGVFGFQTWLSTSNYFDRDPLLARNGLIESFQGDSSEVVIEEAAKFIVKQAGYGKPSFTVIWFGTPHGPFRASEQDCQGFEHLDPKSKNHYGELVAMDRSIGNLRDTLRNHGIADNTLVWFTSDNGGLPRIKPDTVGGLRGFKGNLYEGGIRVPAIVEWPAGIPQPRSTDFPAVAMDILPTLAELTETSLESMVQPIDGTSLVPLFAREIGKRDTRIPFAFKQDLAVIDNQYKLIRKNWNNTNSKSHELYDLANDASETVNIFSSHREVASKLESWLDEFSESLANSLVGGDYPDGTVLPGDPEPTRWHTMPKFKPYFKDWGQRPEYRSLLKNANSKNANSR